MSSGLESERPFGSAFAEMGDAVIISDLEGRVVDCNRACAAFFRLPRWEDCPKTVPELDRLIETTKPSGEIVAVEQWPISRALRGETCSHESYVLRNRDTGGKWVASFSYGPMRDAQGVIVGAFASGRDMTESVSRELAERTRTQEALRRSEEMFLAFVDTAFGWIWAVDAQGRYTYASPKVEAALGYSAEEIIGKTRFELMERPEEQRARAVFADILEHRAKYSAITCRYLRKDGRAVFLESSGVPVLSPEGTFLGYRGMERDVTELRAREEQLRQAQKMELVGQLAGGIAHDFNNILAVMMMQVSGIVADPDLGADHRAALGELEGQLKRAASLTRQLLVFGRSTSLNVKPIDLNEVVENLLKMLNRLIGEHISLSFTPALMPSVIEADTSMMEQVVLNLVLNSRDAVSAGGGQIRIQIAEEELVNPDPTHPERRAGQVVRLSVSDTGVGMDGATVKQVFEPFFTTKEVGKGTGLGLATVQGVVAQHNGWIEVESQQGVGTTFRVYLPKARPRKGVPAQAPQKSPVKRGGETILLVEDDPQLRKLATKILKGLGYQVHAADNGREALDVWLTHGPSIDLLLTDVVMPENISGIELAERLKGLKPNLKVILSSGYGVEVSQFVSNKRKDLRFLPKPYEAEGLAAAVRDCLDSAP